MQFVSLNTCHHQGPCKPSSCTTFSFNSHWAELPQDKKKKKFCVYVHRVTSGPSNSLQLFVDYGLPDFSVREGVLQARILECIGQYSLLYPSRALYFILPEPPTPLGTWSCQNPCDPSRCTTSTPGPHRGKHKPSRAASGAKPQWTNHMQRWK